MSDTAPDPVPVAPNDPAIVTSLANELAVLIRAFEHSANEWLDQVDQVLVRLQNAGNATTLPDGGVTGQTPTSGPGTPSTPDPTTVPEPTEPPPAPDPATTPDPTTPDPVSDLPPDPVPSTPPEDHSQTIHDPSGDDTFTDPSHDDTITFP